MSAHLSSKDIAFLNTLSSDKRKMYLNTGCFRKKKPGPVPRYLKINKELCKKIDSEIKEFSKKMKKNKKVLKTGDTHPAWLNDYNIKLKNGKAKKSSSSDIKLANLLKKGKQSSSSNIKLADLLKPEKTISPIARIGKTKNSDVKGKKYHMKEEKEIIKQQKLKAKQDKEKAMIKIKHEKRNAKLQAQQVREKAKKNAKLKAQQDREKARQAKEKAKGMLS